jgi:prefoldin subunit 5
MEIKDADYHRHNKLAGVLIVLGWVILCLVGLYFIAHFLTQSDLLASMDILGLVAVVVSALLVGHTASRHMTYMQIQSAISKKSDRVQALHQSIAILQSMEATLSFIKVSWDKKQTLRPELFEIFAEKLECQIDSLYSNKSLFLVMPGQLFIKMAESFQTIFGMRVYMGRWAVLFVETEGGSSSDTNFTELNRHIDELYTNIQSIREQLEDIRYGLDK